jgi:hypothetical protein
MRLSASLSFIGSLAVTVVSAGHHGAKRNHVAIDVSKREESGLSLFKRIDNARLTYYAVSLRRYLWLQEWG